MRSRRAWLGLLALSLIVVSAGLHRGARRAEASPLISHVQTLHHSTPATPISFTPLLAQEGDFMIVATTRDFGAVVSAPSGWDIRTSTGLSGGIQQTFFSKRVDAADVGATFTFGLSGSSPSGFQGSISVYRGVDTANPFLDTVSVHTGSTTSLSIDTTAPIDSGDGFEDVVFFSTSAQGLSTIDSSPSDVAMRGGSALATLSSYVYDSSDVSTTSGPFAFASTGEPGVVAQLTLFLLNPAAPTPTSVSVDVTIDAGADGVGPFGGGVWSASLYRDDGDGAFNPADPLVVSGTTATPLVTPFAGTHWLVVDSRSHTRPSGSDPAPEAWPEQLEGPAGALCWDPDQLAAVERTTPGPCLGGRSPASDDVSTPATSEHVARIDATGTAVSAAYVFSYDLVTVDRDGDESPSAATVQGSLRQFLQNANANEASTMRFVPIEAPTAGATGSWWTITALSTLPAIDAPGVTLDGAAWNWNDQLTARDDNPGALPSPTVGTDAISTSPIPRPELHIVGALASTNAATSLRVQHVAIHAPNGTSLTIGGVGAQLSDLLLGVDPASQAPAQPAQDGLVASAASDGSAVSVYVAENTSYGVRILNGSSDWVFEESEIRDNGSTTATFYGGLWSTERITLERVSVAGNFGYGIGLTGAEGSTVTQSLVTGNGSFGDRPAGIYADTDDITITETVLSWNFGPGLMVTTSAQSVVVDRASFFDNGEPIGQIAIDLLRPSDDQETGSAPFISLNGAAGPGGNGLLDAPVISNAEVTGTDLTVRGWAPEPGASVDIYVATPASPNDEGKTFVGRLVEGSPDDIDTTSSAYSVARGSATNAPRFKTTIDVSAFATILTGGHVVALATTATDGSSEFSDPAEVTVNPPFALGPADAWTLDEMEPFAANVTITPADPANLVTWSLAAGADPVPTGLTIGPGGLLEWTPDESQGPATYGLVVEAELNGDTVALPITLTVDEVNRPPTISLPSTPLMMSMGSVAAGSPTVADPDLPANGLSFSATGLPPDFAIDPTTGEYGGTITGATPPGTYTVTVTVTDDGSPALSASDTRTIEVAPLLAPVVDAGPDRTAGVGEPILLEPAGSDPDGTLVGWSWTSTGSATFDPGPTAAMPTVTYTQPGSYTLTLEVTDNDGLTSTDSLSVNITPPTTTTTSTTTTTTTAPTTTTTAPSTTTTTAPSTTTTTTTTAAPPPSSPIVDAGVDIALLTDKR